MRLRAAATHPLLTPYPPGDLNPASLLAAFQPHTRRITTHLIVCVTTVGLVMRKNSTNNSAASKQRKTEVAFVFTVLPQTVGMTARQFFQPLETVFTLLFAGFVRKTAATATPTRIPSVTTVVSKLP